MQEHPLTAVPETDSPEDLIAAAKRGDREAFGVLARACERMLYRVSRTVLLSDADCADAVQETLYRAWYRLGSLREPAHFRTWLVRILLNECSRQLRQARKTVPLDALPAEETAPDEFADLNTVLGALPKRYRIVLTLHYAEGLPVEEVARALPLPAGTVKNRLASAREMLAAAQDPKGEVPKEDLEKHLQALYPPTPASFSMNINHTLRALPKRRRRFRLSIPAAIAYTVAAFFAVALLASSLYKPPKAAPAETPRSTPYRPISTTPVPPLTPLTVLSQLTVTPGAAKPASQDKWQIAAACGDVAWYYRADTAELALATSKGTSTMKLALAQGQTVDTCSFMPGKLGRWLAFTVHDNGVDSVWLVTQDGRQLLVTDDVPRPERDGRTTDDDLIGIRMLPFGNQPFLLREQSAEEAPGESLLVRVSYANGSVNLVEYALEYPDGGEGPSRRYILSYSETNGCIVIIGDWWVTRSYADYPFDRNFLFNECSALQKGNYAMFRIMHSPDGAPERTCRALLMNEDDPNRTLWMMDIISGDKQKVTEDCAMAAWSDYTDFWYVTADDASTMKTTPGQTGNQRQPG